MTEQQTQEPLNSNSSVPLHIGSLDEKVYKECEKMRKDIASFRQRISAHEPIPPAEYFEIGMYLSSFRMYVSDFLLLHEAGYREEKVAGMAETSVAAAEAKARAGANYRAYKYLERMDTLADEITKLIKKFEGRMLDDGTM